MTATIGHNQSPFHLTTDHIQELYDEVKNWCDGEPLTTKEQHDTLVQLVRDIRTAKTEADNARKEEAKPFDEGKKEVQGRYNPFIQAKTGKVALAIESAQQVLAPYLQEQERLKNVEEQRLIDAALEAEKVALAAMQASSGDLEAREEAEKLVVDAKKIEAAYKREVGTNIAKGAKTVWDTEIVDSTAAIRHLWTWHKDEFEALILDIGKGRVRAGARDIPGFKITSRKVI